MSAALNAALDYSRRGWPIVPFMAKNGRKVPLTEHGVLDATLDENQIAQWCKRPDVLVAIATGKPSGIVALDVDIRADGSGRDSLEALGVNFHPSTPTDHTPGGGYHCLFAWPSYEVPNSAGKLGRYLDVRGDGGALILPPGPGRFWDPHLGPDLPLAQMPEWMVIREPAPVRPTTTGAVKPIGELSAYCEAALDNAFRRIIDAPVGQQESTLNKESFGLATLVAAWGMPPRLALDALQKAASKMPTYDRRRPWRQKEIERKITDGFAAGLRRPRARHE